MTLGERLKQLRKDAGLTQEQLAQKAGLKKQNISRYENSHIEPNIRTAKRIADALGVTIEDIASEIEPFYSCSLFKEKLKQYRETAGFHSQLSFANSFGVPLHAVQDWESGVREPTYDTLVRLCDFFKITADQMLGMVWDLDDRSSRPSVNLTDDETELIADYRDATEEIREEAAGMLHRSAERNRKDRRQIG